MGYRSCGYLEGGLVLGNGRLQFCCVQHSDGKKGFVKICDYDGGELPLETIRAERARLVALNNTPGADSPCEGCWNLVEREWPAREFPFDWIGIESFFACNLRCVYCDVVLHEDWRLPQAGYDLQAVFAEMLARGWLAPGARIVWGGGESLALKGFERLQELLRVHDVHQQIHTNAIRHSESIAATLALGQAELVCSVDAGSATTYRRIKGGDCFEDVWRNLATYRASGADVTLKYIVRAGNTAPADVLGFVRRALALGVKKIAISADKEELAQDALSEEHALAVALLARAARAGGIEVTVLAEYLPAERTRFVGALDAPDLDRRLARAAVRRFWSRCARVLRQRARRLVGSLRSGPALRRVARLGRLRDPEPAAVLALFEQQTRHPSARLAAALVDGARRLGPALVSADGQYLGIGLALDGWQGAARPAFVALDNRRGATPLEQVLWVACYAGEGQLPLRVELGHALGAVSYTFWCPERRRIVLPPVPAGECAVFAVRTDRYWRPVRGDDERELGVHLSARVELAAHDSSGAVSS